MGRKNSLSVTLREDGNPQNFIPALQSISIWNLGNKALRGDKLAKDEFSCEQEALNHKEKKNSTECCFILCAHL